MKPEEEKAIRLMVGTSGLEELLAIARLANDELKGDAFHAACRILYLGIRAIKIDMDQKVRIP